MRNPAQFDETTEMSDKKPVQFGKNKMMSDKPVKFGENSERNDNEPLKFNE